MFVLSMRTARTMREDLRSYLDFDIILRNPGYNIYIYMDMSVSDRYIYIVLLGQVLDRYFRSFFLARKTGDRSDFFTSEQKCLVCRRYEDKFSSSFPPRSCFLFFNVAIVRYRYLVRGNFANESHALATFCTTFISDNFESVRSLKSWQNGRQSINTVVSDISREMENNRYAMCDERILLGCI